MGFRLSNVIGAPFRDFVVNQLATRVAKSSTINRDIEQVLYLGNKMAWVRLNSSVDVSEEYKNYLKQAYSELEGFTYTSGDNLAKNWVLGAGTSKQDKDKTTLRSGIGLDGAYGLGGIQDQGYRPMPGLDSVTIETAGKLGSLRFATINFKVWNMNQLDVIDALYFRLGFTMLLEWGHVTYFTNDGKLETKPSGIDSFFQPKVTKEDIQYDINQKMKETDGNYDAMLGTVTNFTYSMNQEGGWDCSLKLIGLGSMMETQKINGLNKLPPGTAATFKKINAQLAALAAQQKIQAAQIANQEKYNAAAAVAASASAENAKNFPVTDQPSLFKATYGSSTVNISDSQNVGNVLKQMIVGPTGGTNVEAPVQIQEFTGGQNDPFAYIAGQKIYYPRIAGYSPLTVGDLYNVDLRTMNQVALLNEANTSRNNGITDYIKTAVSPLTYDNTIKARQAAPSYIADAGFSWDKNLKIWFKPNYVNLNSYGFKTRFAVTIPEIAGPDNDTVQTAISNNFGYIDPSVIEKQIALKVQALVNGNQYADNNRWELSEIVTKEFSSGNAKLENGSANSIGTPTPPNYTSWLTLTRQFIIEDVILYNGFSVAEDGTVIKGSTFPANGPAKPIKIYVTVYIQTENINSLLKLAKAAKPPLEVKTPNRNAAEYNQGTSVTEADKNQTNQDAGLASALEAMLTIAQYTAITSNRNASQVTPISLEKLTGELLNYLDGAPMKGLFKSDGTLLTPQPISPFTGKDPKNYKDPFCLGLKGYNTSLMSGQIDKEDDKTQDHYSKIKEVNFKELMTGYLLPKQITDSNEQGGLAAFQEPVYIKLGYLLFFINNLCLLYDNTKPATRPTDTVGVARPHFYIDFNPATNFCLTTSAQFSIDPQVCLIPAVADATAYKSLFTVPPSAPFNFATSDIVSQKIPAFRSEDANGKYKGLTMNILVNTQHLLNLLKDTADRDNHNDVYLRPFLDRLMADINKSLGDVNAFRVGYIDASNTVVILDDQFVPPALEEENILRRSVVDASGKAIIPIFGQTSIARSLEFQTNITSKMSSMIAIGARSSNSGSTQSTDASSLYYLNRGLTDRIISQTEDIAKVSPATKINTNKSKNDTVLADKFNTYVSTIYGTSNSIDKGSVDMARNYYIQGMTNSKAQDEGVSGTPIIPLNLSFSTDGISGMNMGNVFLIPENRMPISLRGLDGTPRFGYMVVGLNHQIQNNQWITNVRGQIIKLRPDDSYKQAGSISAAKGSIIASSVPANNTPLGGGPYNPSNGAGGYAEQTTFVVSSTTAALEARKVVETYLGRAISDAEWNQLVALTSAESGDSEKGLEDAYIAATVLNRTRSGRKTITATLNVMSAFQPVAGVRGARFPAQSYVTGPASGRESRMYAGFIAYLPGVNKRINSFTAMNPATYKKGTNINYLYTLLARPVNKVIGGNKGTVFAAT